MMIKPIMIKPIRNMTQVPVSDICMKCIILKATGKSRLLSCVSDKESGSESLASENGSWNFLSSALLQVVFFTVWD